MESFSYKQSGKPDFEGAENTSSPVSAVKHFKEESTCIFSNDFKSVKLNKNEFWKKLQADYWKMRYSAAQSRKQTAHENKWFEKCMTM